MVVIQVTTMEEFNAIINSPKLIIDFYATWCKPCMAISPYLAALSNTYPDITFAKIDVEELDQIVDKFGICNMPTFISFKNGVKQNVVIGAMKEKIDDMIVSLNC